MVKRYFRKTSVLLACAGVLLFCGCRTPPEETPRFSPWTMSELENRLAGPDPIEPFNRAMFSVQHLLMEYPVDWIGRVYTSILPRPVITAINNLCLNLEFPARGISCLLRAEWRGAWHELLRFLTNSTLGIAGLFDVGRHWFGLYSTDSDFGQTFHAWGIDPGCTFILPFLPRINFRDAGGFIFDCAFDAKTYIPYSSVVRLNQVIVAQEAYHGAVAGSGDPYKTFREAMVLRRELQNRLWFYRVGDREKELFAPAPDRGAAPPLKTPAGLRGQWHDLPLFGEASPLVSSLRVLLWRPRKRGDWWYMPLSVFNRDFANRMKKIRVGLPGGGEVVCGFWRPPAPCDYSDPGKVPPAPRLAVILPGIGGAYDGGSTLALAEMLNRGNCAVLTLDCPFSGSFMVQSRSGKLPGGVTHDAEILRGVLAAAFETLEREELIHLPEKLLIGYSFGGLYTLKLAEMEHREPRLGFEHFIALNPPVELKYASIAGDLLCYAGLGWTERECFDRLAETAGRLFTASELDGKSDAYGAMPLLYPEERPAALLAGLYFRLPLRHILFHARREGMKVPLRTPYSWWRRNRLYLEIDRVGFREYAEKFAAPCYPGVPLEKLYAQGDLRTFRDLGRIPGVKVFHTWDDPLLAPMHRLFLDRTFGGNMHWFSRGGHLGHLYLPEVQKKIVEAAFN